MAKRKRAFAQGETLSFNMASTDNPISTADLSDHDLSEEETQFLDEAQEALSKLYQKVHKRGQAVRGGRKREAWD